MKFKVFLITASLALAGTSALAVTTPAPPKKVESKHDTYSLLNLFGEVFEKVKSDYVEDVPDDKLIESAINGMLTSLDPHSSYLDNKEYGEMRVQTKGEFGGLGIEVTLENGLVKVVSPIDDTPAYKAGVKSGDYISHLDDEPVMGMTLSDAVGKMRGRVGTKIKLTILREGENAPIEKSLIREVIKVQSVRSRAEGTDIGYIRITSFSEQTAAGLRDAIEKLQKQLGPNLKGFILDLRNNPGGLLDQAIEVSDDFVEQGEIVSTRGRTTDAGKRYNATKGDITKGLPVVVLINGGSASASEIVAGALQDQKRAIILGTKSFGKGSVQTIIPLTGFGAMRLTTSRYYTPSGRSIQAEGIEPDIKVEQAEIKFIEPNKYMRTEASLNGHLSNPTEKPGEKPLPNLPIPTEDNSISKDKSKIPDLPMTEDMKKKKEQEESYKDFQLARAIDLLRGLNVFSKK